MFAIIATITGLVVVVPWTGSGKAALRSAAYETAALLRAARTRAIDRGRAQTVLVDVGRRVIRAGHGARPVRIGKDIGIKLTSSAKERRSAGVAGIRFFPNGSSTGGTLRYTHRALAFEVRVSWLNGRVSVGTRR